MPAASRANVPCSAIYGDTFSGVAPVWRLFLQANNLRTLPSQDTLTLATGLTPQVGWYSESAVCQCSSAGCND